MLRVGDEDQEAHDDGDVEEQGDRLDDAVDARSERGQHPGERVRGEGPLAEGEEAGVDLCGPVEQKRQDHAEDGQ